MDGLYLELFIQQRWKIRIAYYLVWNSTLIFNIVIILCKYPTVAGSLESFDMISSKVVFIMRADPGP